MATIQGDTGRGMHLFSTITAGQALGLLATAAVGCTIWSLCASMPLRLALSLPAATFGGVYTVGRWPPGPDGERMAVWLPRLLRYWLRPRVRFGAQMPGWEGLCDVREEWLRHDSGWAVVVECTGTDCVARGPEAVAAAQVAYRELLHALEAPLQVVGIARWLRAADRPPLWDPLVAPSGLVPIAEAYSAYWADLVRARRCVARRCLFVLSTRATSGLRRCDAEALQAAMSRFASRLGLSARRIRGAALARLLLESAGASDTTGGAPSTPGYRVGGPHA